MRRLHLTPQQLLSLRDFLGAFSRGVEVEPAESGLFILRQQGSMAYTGEFALLLRSDRALQVDRVTGPATLDLTRSVQVPLRLLPKPRAQLLADLGGAQIANPDPAPSAGGEAHPDAAASEMTPGLPSAQISALKPAGAATIASAVQSRAVFAPDGSGIVATVRAENSQPPLPMRLSLRYYSAIRSDGARVWREAVSEFDADVQLDMHDLETRFSCKTAICASARGIPPSSSFHMIRWQRQYVAAVPPTLLAQLAPAPAPSASPMPVMTPEASPPPPLGAAVPQPDTPPPSPE